jgi:hypothetical protein
LKKAEKEAAKKLKKELKRKLNGHASHANGKLMNGHGGKAAAGKMPSAKSGIFAKARGRQGEESRALA